MLCADIAQKQFIPLLPRLRAHDVAEFPALLSHQREEFLYVLTGDIEIHTDQYLPLRPEKGDSRYFDSTMGHGMRISRP